MFGDFLRRLTAPSPAPLPDEDARLALSALLVRLARSDGHYASEEVEQIEQVIATRYGLPRIRPPACDRTPKRWKPKPRTPFGLPAQSKTLCLTKTG